MIELRRVGVQVGTLTPDGPQTRTILSDIDLTLTEDRIAIIGANGSGKSTLLRLLNGLVLPTSGEVIVAGHSTAKAARQVRQLVGFIFTDPLAQLVTSTPVDDVALSLKRVVPDRRARRARAMELLTERGLGQLANQSIYDLSGGERQLVSLTTVLAIDPAIVVADEPTTLLDLRNRDLLRRAFRDLDQQVIYATHDLELATEADRGVVVHDGRIAFDGMAADAVTWYRQAMA